MGNEWKDSVWSAVFEHSCAQYEETVLGWLGLLALSALHPPVSRSQNGLGWESPLELLWSNLLLKQGHLEQAAQDHVQTSFGDLCGWRLHSLFGKPIPVLCNLHRKETPLMFSQNLLDSSLCSLPLVMALGRIPDTVWKGAEMFELTQKGDDFLLAGASFPWNCNANAAPLQYPSNLGRLKFF